MKVTFCKTWPFFLLLIQYSCVMLQFCESFILCKITIAQVVTRTSSADSFFAIFLLSVCSASQRIIKLFNIFSSGITINSLLPLFYWAVMQLFKELKINLNISILFKIINIVVVKDIMTYKVWMRAFVWNPDLVWCWTFFPWKKPASHFMRERERELPGNFSPQTSPLWILEIWNCVECTMWEISSGRIFLTLNMISLCRYLCSFEDTNVIILI